MHKKIIHIQFILSVMGALLGLNSCKQSSEISLRIIETSSAGNKLKEIEPVDRELSEIISLKPEEKFQVIEGFGGSFTAASAHIFSSLNDEKRKEILNAYFSEEGANYSLTRTHINSCDFSLYNYAYAMTEGDTSLEHFDIKEDLKELIPMIKEANRVSKNSFKIISSPWTAPPWMKDNKDWKGGKLLKEYYQTWALYFKKYIQAYAENGIPIWAITVENEPLGNDNNWESMLYTPEEMNLFVKNYLGPEFKHAGLTTRILGFDQNRDEELITWATAMYQDSEAYQYYDGIAVHWYASTYDHFPNALQSVHAKAPGKLIIQTEACIDAEVPRWQDDAWYWSKKARDWGWTWAPENKKYLHPEYVPVHRYANDIIGCLNNHVNGWVDWNMVLDKNGGPNWAKNWCTAPVIADTSTNEIYLTPLYYVMVHFSKYIRPGAVRIGFSNPINDINFTAVKNTDGSIVCLLLNTTVNSKEFKIKLDNQEFGIQISPNALQTIVLTNKDA